MRSFRPTEQRGSSCDLWTWPSVIMTPSLTVCVPFITLLVCITWSPPDGVTTGLFQSVWIPNCPSVAPVLPPLPALLLPPHHGFTAAPVKPSLHCQREEGMLFHIAETQTVPGWFIAYVSLPLSNYLHMHYYIFSLFYKKVINLWDGYMRGRERREKF